MKKIFTLIAATMMAVGASAQTYKSDFTDQQTFDATTTNVDAAVTAGWMAHNGTEKGNQKPGITLDTEEVTTDGQSADYYKIKQKGTRDITVYITGVSKLKVFVKNSSNGARNLYASVNDGAEQTLASPDKTSAVGEISLEKEENNKIVLYADNDIYLVGLKFTTADNLTPSLSANPDELSLSAKPSNTSPSATFTIIGKNLTAGTYNLTVPNLAGLEVNPTSFTVDADGKVSQEVTVTYTSTADVAKANTTISATVGELSAAVNVNYQSRSTAYTQSIVKADATWDWSQLTESLQLNDETTPKKGDEYILAEVDDRITFTDAFGDAKALKVDLEHPSRAGFAQGNTIKFTTNRAGKLAVDFSNTGKDRPYRYLNVNGTSTTFKSATTDKVSATEIEVPAGEVVITGYIEDATDPQAKDGEVVGPAGLRFYKIVFTATGEPVEPSTGINTVATDAAKANVVKKYVDGKQVVIEKNGKKYNVAGAQIK